MIPNVKSVTVAVLIFVTSLIHIQAEAAFVEYDLTIARQKVNFTGKHAFGMTINGTIPGPVLRFKEGDIARIRVHNKMNVETSIHWHGVLVPPDMDGVPYVSFPPIMPDTSFTYEFPIRHSGTYWYHSHTSLQEQSGVYGSIVIEPRQDGPTVDRDYVVMLSDWTDERTHEVLRTLKRGSEWYALQKGSSQSIIGSVRLGMLGDYYQRELRRMPAMDISDIAYDRFFANGKPEITLAAKPGETVRLRIIDGGAGTNFHLEFAGGPMAIVAADGQDVEPVREKRFLIAIAETYDVLVKVPAPGAYEFRATAHDGSGYASIWLGTGKRHPAPDVPRPNLYSAVGHMAHLTLKHVFALTPPGAMGMPNREVEAGRFDRPGMMGMGSMHGMGHGVDHSSMNMGPKEPVSAAGDGSRGHSMDHGGRPRSGAPQVARTGKEYGSNFRFLAADLAVSEDLAVDGIDPSRPWPPYDRLRATRRTALPKDKPVRQIRLTLDGDMERYVWTLNNKTLSESDAILIREGEVARFIMINRTMMHHPMHLHGHFFRLINGQGDYAPLKHTVNVAPMSTTVIEFDANEFGDWFFHCHLLYHMKSGMARVVHYEDFTLNPRLAAVRPNLYRDSWYFWGQADVLSNMTEGFLMFSSTRNIFTAEWEVGWQDVDDSEWEGILTWERYINRFFTFFAGADLLDEGRESDKTRGVFGFHYLLPLNVAFRTWIDTDGGARVNLGKIFDLTPRLALFGETQYDSHEKWENSAGLSYMIEKHFSLVFQWHSDYEVGGGLQVRF